MSTATLELRADSRQVRTATSDLERLNGVGAKSERVGRRMTGVYRTLGGVFAALGASRALRAIVGATVEQERVTAQLNQTLRSTGRFSEEASQELQRYAAQLQQVTAFGDEAIISSQALLLTFTRIGGDIFPRAQEAILDVATAMGTDLRSASQQVGRALNDPILGLTALSRSGIQFSEVQRQNIRDMVEMGDVAAAQAIILGELETQFGGSARAARNTLGGALASLKNSFGDLLEGDSGSIQGAVDGVNELNATLNDPAVQQGFATMVEGALTLVGALASATAGLNTFVRTVTDNMVGVEASIEDLFLAKLEESRDELARLDSELARPRAFRINPFVSTEDLEKRRVALVTEIELYERSAESARNRFSAVDGEADDEAEANANLAVTIEAVSDAEESATAARNAAIESIQKVRQSLEDQIYELENGERAYELLIATRQAGIALDSEEAAGLADLIDKRNELTEAQREQARVAREQATAQREFDRLSAELSTAGMDPAELARHQYEARLDVIREAKEREAATEEEARQANLAAEADYQRQLTEIARQESEQRRAVMETQLSGLGDVFGNFADIAREGGEESFNNYKILASAQAGISAALAITRALAEGGPFLGPALATSIGALTAVQIAKINSQQYTPRAAGGQVLDGRQYLVGERGPELITMRGNGQVTPNSQLTQGAQSNINQRADVTFVIPNSDDHIRDVMANSEDIIYNVMNRAFRRQGRNL